MPAGPDEWSKRLRRFAYEECHGSSPLYETIGLALADDMELLRWLAATISPRAHATLPFAAVHHLLLTGTDGGGLEAFYPTLTAAPLTAERVYPAFRAFCERNKDRLAPLLATGLTQTNEVGRCAYLLPALVRAVQRCARPLWIVDVGSSAGLNLLFDRYSYDYGNGHRTGDPTSPVQLSTSLRGAHPQTAPFPVIAGRVGIDLAPIDPGDTNATDWLEACIWPEHTERLRNLRAALDIARRDKPRVMAGNAVDLLPVIAAEADSDVLLVIVNTNVMLYFSRAERARYDALLRQLGAERDLVWIANEHPVILAAAGFDGSIAMLDDGLPLVSRYFSDGRADDAVLAHVGPHCRWLHWY